ncbi:hypothetical protein BST43_04860 [Mycobacteroides saopaulense]|uniref:Uncharacterized protein n=1 Tax=Mycobacteroides saopaulense TaxID=1578165 RepID=A0A1S4VQE8_9MYCO|nr:hypothetical protein MYCSP_09005 [Mycobacteroides saopaulense]ORB60068.1 hypothetical protein BST43_04860 [Mycobacteroides saopaulense]
MPPRGERSFGSLRVGRAALVFSIVAAALAMLVLQCSATPHRDAARVALPHHAVAVGSPRQLSDVVAGVHDHVGRAAFLTCTASDAVATVLSAPAMLRVLVLAVLALAVDVSAAVVCSCSNRGPPPHTAAAAIVGGRTLIHHLCVMRR